MAKLEQRISEMEARLRELRAQQQRITARERALSATRQRKADTRRKILVGAIVLAKVERGEFSDAKLREWLDESLARQDDRMLFDLAQNQTTE